jgi:signal transduction histidine kinase
MNGARATGAAGETVDILLVDDQPSRLITYEAILAPLGHRLVTANSGVQALQRLMEREYAVILLDVSMPEMDGFETARMIHEHPRFEKTPIIFVTGVHVSELDRLKGYELGAVDYVYVPVVPQILRSKVQVLVELHCQRLELQRLNESLALANRELDKAHRKLKRESASELAELNRNLEAANQRLEAANAALMLENEERRRAERALLDADHRKDDFLAILGHELRNPLAPIRSAVEILKRQGPPDPTLVRMRDMIDRQAQHMTRLVDDLLDVSRITRGKINLRLEPTDLGVVVKRALEACQSAIEARRQELAFNGYDEPVLVNGDGVRLGQAIGNLLNNAVKYTPEGGRIEVAVKSDGGSAAVTVRDNGIGIAPEYLEHVFDLFGQVRHPRPHGHDGLGIGLALVRSLVEMHGGRVEARSDGPERGSEFVVWLPLHAASSSEAAASLPAAAFLTGYRILVADDHVDCLESLATMLAVDGNEVRTAANGAEALAAAESFAPDIVLLDIRMPVMDGYEAAQELRKQAFGRNAILVALTGWGQEEHRRLSQFSGFDAHLTKPVDRETLARRVSALIEARRAAAHAPAPRLGLPPLVAVPEG